MKFVSQQSFFDYIKTLRYLASKDLGQNFLINEILAAKIVRGIDPNNGEQILEIGSGFGSLSYFLVRYGTAITLLDIDPKIIAFLSEQFGEMSNVKIIQESILKHDVSTYDKIIGNLPYYITSETIEYCLLNSYRAKSMVFMIQKEVLSRLISKPKQDGYGPLAILVSFLGEAKRVFNVGRSNFVPAPKVDSVVVEINMKQDIDHETARQLHKITNSLFHHRRKTIRNNLTLYLKSSEKADRLIAELGVDGSKRPEELDLSFYLRLIKQLKF